MPLKLNEIHIKELNQFKENFSDNLSEDPMINMFLPISIETTLTPHSKRN